jgi:hypothetical protein
MTIETKTTIELSDVLNVEFECKNCHAVGIWPINNMKNPPVSCPCQPGQQWMVHGSNEHSEILQLIELMRRYAKAENRQFVMRFGLSALGHASVSKV